MSFREGDRVRAIAGSREGQLGKVARIDGIGDHLFIRWDQPSQVTNTRSRELMAGRSHYGHYPAEALELVR